MKVDLATAKGVLLRINRQRIIGGFKLAFDLVPPGPNLAVRSDDTFLISYPKSGNTWTRFLLANLVYSDKSPDFGNIDQLIPGPEGMSKREFNRLPSPRFIRTHSWFDPKYKHVIYIVRDPRDMIVSQFHYHRKRKVIDDDCSIDAFVTSFLLGETDPHRILERERSRLASRALWRSSVSLIAL